MRALWCLLCGLFCLFCIYCVCALCLYCVCSVSTQRVRPANPSTIQCILCVYSVCAVRCVGPEAGVVALAVVISHECSWSAVVCCLMRAVDCVEPDVAHMGRACMSTNVADRYLHAGAQHSICWSVTRLHAVCVVY
jgi:hypothetical protein